MISFWLSVPPGWWLPGDFHQPSGDRKDPSAGGRRDHHGAKGQRSVRHQGLRILGTLQGEKCCWGQRCMYWSLPTIQLETKGPCVADVVQMLFCGGAYIDVSLLNVRCLVELMSENHKLFKCLCFHSYNSILPHVVYFASFHRILDFSFWMWCNGNVYRIYNEEMYSIYESAVFQE